MPEAQNRMTYIGSRHRTTLELDDWYAQAPEEIALEPELPILDSHHHLYGALGDTYYYRVEDLARDFAGGHRLIGTVYVEGYDSAWHESGPESLRPVGETEMIVRATAAPIKLPFGNCVMAAGIVAHANLSLGDATAEVLEAHIEAGMGRLRGVRHQTARDEGLVGRFIKNLPLPQLLRDAQFRRGLAQVQSHGLTFDAWVFHHQLDDLIELADAFPDVQIVTDHVGGLIGAGYSSAEHIAHTARWRQDLRKLAERPNVSIKVGGLGMPLFGFGFEYGDRPATSAQLAHAWKPLIDSCIEAFGPSRCMFESNFPVDKQSGGYTSLWNAYKLATGSLSAEERADMFYRTACRVYRLQGQSLLTNSAAGQFARA